MTDLPLPAAPLDPYVTGVELAAHLGGGVTEAEAEPYVYAATTAVFAVVRDPGWQAPDLPVPAAVRQVTLNVGAELYRAGQAPGGDFQVDAFGSVPAVVTSNLLRKYGAALAGFRRIGGLVG